MANKMANYPRISRNKPYCKIVYKRQVAPVNGKPGKVTITFKTYLNTLNNNIMWKFHPYVTMYSGTLNEANNIIRNILTNFPEAEFTRLSKDTKDD